MAYVLDLESRCAASPHDPDRTVLDLTTYWPQSLQDFRITLAAWHNAPRVSTLVITSAQLLAFGRSVSSLTGLAQVAVWGGSKALARADASTHRDIASGMYEAACPLRYVALDAVQSLALTHVAVGGAALRPWRRALDELRPHLTSLVLSDTSLGADELEFLLQEFVARGSHLQLLQLGAAGGGRARERIFTALLRQRLTDGGTKLVLRDVLGGGREHVAAALSLLMEGRIRTLDVRDVATWRAIGAAVVEQIADPSSQVALRTLDLRKCCRLADTDVADMAAALRSNATVRRLRIPGCAVSGLSESALYEMLAGSYECMLQSVDISGPRIASDTAVANKPRVAGLLKVRDLMLMQDADLSQLQPRELSAAGVGHVARLVTSAPCLRSLNLSGAALSESTLQVLVTALLERQRACVDKRDAGLTELVLSDTELGDDCRFELARLIQSHTTLDALLLKDNNLSPVALTTLRHAVAAASSEGGPLDLVDIRGNAELTAKDQAQLDHVIDTGLDIVTMPDLDTGVKPTIIVGITKMASRTLHPSVGGLLATTFRASVLLAPGAVVTTAMDEATDAPDASKVPGVKVRRTLADLRHRTQGEVRVQLAQVTPGGRTVLPPLPDAHEYVGNMAVELRPRNLVYKRKSHAILSLHHGLNCSSRARQGGLRVFHFWGYQGPPPHHGYTGGNDEEEGHSGGRRRRSRMSHVSYTSYGSKHSKASSKSASWHNGGVDGWVEVPAKYLSFRGSMVDIATRRTGFFAVAWDSRRGVVHTEAYVLAFSPVGWYGGVDKLPVPVHVVIIPHTPGMPDVFHRRLDQACEAMRELDPPCAYAGGMESSIALPHQAEVRVSMAGQSVVLHEWDGQQAALDTFHVPVTAPEGTDSQVSRIDVQAKMSAAARRASVVKGTSMAATPASFEATLRLVNTAPIPPRGLRVCERKTSTTTIEWDPPHPYSDLNPGTVRYEVWLKPLTTGQYANKDIHTKGAELSPKAREGTVRCARRSTVHTKAGQRLLDTDALMPGFECVWRGATCCAELKNTFQAGLVHVVAANQAGLSDPSEVLTVHPARGVRKMRRSSSAKLVRDTTPLGSTSSMPVASGTGGGAGANSGAGRAGTGVAVVNPGAGAGGNAGAGAGEPGVAETNAGAQPSVTAVSASPPSPPPTLASCAPQWSPALPSPQQGTPTHRARRATLRLANLVNTLDGVDMSAGIPEAAALGSARRSSNDSQSSGGQRSEDGMSASDVGSGSSSGSGSGSGRANEAAPAFGSAQSSQQASTVGTPSQRAAACTSAVPAMPTSHAGTPLCRSPAGVSPGLFLGASASPARADADLAATASGYNSSPTAAPPTLVLPSKAKRGGKSRRKWVAPAGLTIDTAEPPLVPALTSTKSVDDLGLSNAPRRHAHTTRASHGRKSTSAIKSPVAAARDELKQKRQARQRAREKSKTTRHSDRSAERRAALQQNPRQSRRFAPDARSRLKATAARLAPGAGAAGGVGAGAGAGSASTRSPPPRRALPTLRTSPTQAKDGSVAPMRRSVSMRKRAAPPRKGTSIRTGAAPLDLTALVDFCVVTLDSPAVCAKKRFSFTTAGATLSTSPSSSPATVLARAAGAASAVSTSAAGAAATGAAPQPQPRGTLAQARSAAVAELSSSQRGSPVSVGSRGSPAMSRSPTEHMKRRLRLNLAPVSKAGSVSSGGSAAMDSHRSGSARTQWDGLALNTGSDSTGSRSPRSTLRRRRLRFTPGQQQEIAVAEKELADLASPATLRHMFGCTATQLVNGLAATHEAAKLARVPLVYVLLEALACLGIRAERAQCHQFNSRLLVSSMQRAVGAAYPVFARHYQLTLPTTRALIQHTFAINKLISSFSRPGWLGQGLRSKWVMRQFVSHSKKLASVFGTCRMPEILHLSYNLRATHKYVHEKVVQSGALRYAAAAVGALVKGEVDTAQSLGLSSRLNKHQGPKGGLAGVTNEVVTNAAHQRFANAAARELTRIMMVPPHHVTRLSKELLLLRDGALQDLASQHGRGGDGDGEGAARLGGSLKQPMKYPASPARRGKSMYGLPKAMVRTGSMSSVTAMPALVASGHLAAH